MLTLRRLHTRLVPRLLTAGVLTGVAGAAFALPAGAIGPNLNCESNQSCEITFQGVNTTADSQQIAFTCSATTQDLNVNNVVTSTGVRCYLALASDSTDTPILGTDVGWRWSTIDANSESFVFGPLTESPAPYKVCMYAAYEYTNAGVQFSTQSQSSVWCTTAPA